MREGIKAVRAFISAHMTSRFMAAWDPNHVERLTNLAGYRKKNEATDGWDFYITTGAWPEVTAGFDPKALAAVLVERGLLTPPDSGQRRTQLIRVPGYGPRRLYHIPAKILDGEDG